jgi:type IV pilus assembly protein PilF
MHLLLFIIACVTPQREARSETRTKLGTAYISEGNPTDAIMALEEATKLNPRNAAAWEKLGIAYYAKGATIKAEHAFQKAIKLAPEKAEIRNNYGLMLLNEKRIDEAIEHFNVALADLTYRNTAIVLNNLGQAYYQKKEYDSSIQVLTQCISRAPNLCQAKFNRGLTYRAMEEDALALSDFEEVIDLCGDTATGAYYQAAQIFIDRGDVPAGCSYYQTVIREAGKSKLGKNATKRHAEKCQ